MSEIKLKYGKFLPLGRGILWVEHVTFDYYYIVF